MTRQPGQVAVALLLSFISLPALAAGAFSVNGTIEDSAGDPLAGARVTLTNPSGSPREVVSDTNGWISFEGVEPGEYQLRAEATMHQPFEMLVRVTHEVPKPLTIRMKVGLAEEISVTGVNPDQERTGSTNNADAIQFDADLIGGLPVPASANGLMGFAAAFLSPAAQGTDEVSIVVDGVDGGASTMPSFAIERIKANRHPYSPEFRRPGKARLDVKTQDGSRRRFEGGAAFYLQDSAFAWKNAFASSKPEQRRRLFELSLGGPLWHALGSFFLSVQREMVDEEVIVNAETLDGPVNELIPHEERVSSAIASLYFRAAGLNRLGVRYQFSRGTSFDRGVGGLSLPERAYDSREGPRHSVQAWAKTIVSTSYVNDARVTLVARNRREGHPAEGPAIEVNGAFSGGSNQVFRVNDSLFVEAKELGTYIRGAHAWRFGAGFRSTSVDETEASGFGGLYEFASLDDYDQGTPYVYRVSRGDPDLSFSYREFEAFVQDEVKLRSDLGLMAGLRYDYTSGIGDTNNLGARLALAWSPGNQTTVYRAGLGFFYERVPIRALERRLLWDGTRIRNFVVTNPSYPDPLADDTAAPPQSIFRFAPELVTPYLFQATIATERQVSRRSRITLEYAFVRGIHLFRGRDVNAPLPGVAARPDPSHGEILEAQSTGSAHSHALTSTYRGRIGSRVRAQAQYTLAWARNDVGSANPGFPFELPADNYDLGPEWGRADFDRRHRFNLAGVAELPKRINLGVTLQAWSAEPYDITTGSDGNGDGHALDRPAGVARNTGTGPDFFQVDVRLSKSWTAASLFKGERQRPGEIQCVIDAYNLSNRVNYSPYIGVMTSPFFGEANAAKDARSLQFAIKYRF